MPSPSKAREKSFIVESVVLTPFVSLRRFRPAQPTNALILSSTNETGRKKKIFASASSGAFLPIPTSKKISLRNV
jgi:hypothetical protein